MFLSFSMLQMSLLGGRKEEDKTHCDVSLAAVVRVKVSWVVFKMAPEDHPLALMTLRTCEFCVRGSAPRSVCRRL